MARITENSGSTFVSKGGELGIQVKSNVTWNFTLDGNGDWLKIKNEVGEQVNSITGKNDSIITLVASENEDSEDRECYGYCDSEQYDSPTEHDATVKIFQFGSYFYLNGVSAATLSVQSTVTNPYTFVVDTSYNVNDIIVTVTGNSSIVQDKTLTQNSFAISFYDNEDETAKTATVEFRKDNKLVGKLSITQNAKEVFKVNLKINNSTSPNNIGSAVTSFSISTTPNDNSKSYTIYVNGTSFTSATGNYNGSYICGVNPDESERTFTVTCEDETVTIKQNPKYVAQTRIVQVAGSGAQWSVNMTPSRVTAGCDISFNISVSDATGTITGSVYGDNPGITVTTDMNGTIELRTTTLSAFDLTLDLNIESGGPRFGIYPYSGNVYGFNSGEIGGGVGGYHTYGTIPIKAGEPDSVTRESLDDMTWELADD